MVTKYVITLKRRPELCNKLHISRKFEKKLGNSIKMVEQ